MSHEQRKALRAALRSAPRRSTFNAAPSPVSDADLFGRKATPHTQRTSATLTVADEWREQV